MEVRHRVRSPVLPLLPVLTTPLTPLPQVGKGCVRGESCKLKHVLTGKT